MKLGSHQYLTQVGGDCGGTNIDFVNCKWNGNVCDDVGGSYVIVSEMNSGVPNVEVEGGVNLKDGGVVKVENGGVVIVIGEDDGEFSVEGGDFGLSVGINKGASLCEELVVQNRGFGVKKNGPDNCESRDEGRLCPHLNIILASSLCERKINNQDGLKDKSVVEVETGEGVVEDGGIGYEVMVKDQIALKDKTVGEIENGIVVVGDGVNDHDDTVYENNCGLSAMMNKDVALHDELLATEPISLVENGQSVEVNVDDQVDYDKLREQIKDAQLLIDEKTIKRDNILSKIEMKTAKLQSINIKFEATISDERAARTSVKFKRREIDSIQDRITRVKNSISVIDITNRITHMEHMVEHETNPLKEGNQLLCEINTLKKLRDQISSNVCPADEVALTFSQMESLEIQLKTLKRQLSDLKMKVSNAKAALILLENEYNGECQKVEKLQAQFRAINNARQDTYKDFLSLKRQLRVKSKHFRMYKDEAETSNDYVLRPDVETKVEDTQQTEEELKEKIRQEERAKAQEALERKKRNTEKVQMRAMLRAQKEAEEKEKERKRRQNKKEKKNVDGETGLILHTESTKDERMNSSRTQLKKISQVNKYIKSKPAPIPPALRRGKGRIKELMWWIPILILLFIFMLVGNEDNHRQMKSITNKDNKFSGNH